jgi:hypothetical protein
VPAAAMGCVLADRAVVGRVATRSVLVRSPAGEPKGHAVGSGLAGVGVLPADRPGQRVEAAPRLVRPQCHGRPSGLGFSPGGTA